MSVVAFIERCVAVGMPMDMAMLAAKAFEAQVAVSYPAPKSGAERQRTYREKHPVAKVTRSDEVRYERHETSPEIVSPRPPSDNPPISPPKGGQLSPLDQLAEDIWAMQPVLDGKRRSTRPDTRRALQAACKTAAPAEIQRACRAFYSLPESQKQGGQFAMGAERLLKADRWREFLPRPEPPPGPVTADMLAYRHRHFRDTGEWRPDWGKQPEIAA